MRERIAIGISILAMVVLVALSVVFALRQNPGTAPAPFASAASGAPAGPITGTDEPGADLQERDSVAGLRVFRASNCERCHSVAGVGSPRYPLDGVGSRRSQDELRAWTVGAASVQDSLSPSALRAKQRYQQLSAEELRLLLFFMARLSER
jgi:cytochrome c553